MGRKLRLLSILAASCARLNATDPQAPPAQVAATEVVNGEGEALPASPVRALSSMILEAQFRSARRYLMLAGCRVAPLSEIEEPEAVSFELKAETAPADVDSLRPDTSQALGALQAMVTSLGGTFELKSAYRPAAYQAHLREVWVKWVKELRGNRASGCQALREEVGAEFKRHHLMVRQQPVPASDHALGLAFDAVVAMPRGARLNGKRVTLDKLAGMAGITRPSSRRDPVHFKLLPERPAPVSDTHNISNY